MPVNPHAYLQIRLVDTFEQLVTQLCGNGFDLLDQRQGRCAEDDFFRPTVFHHGLALHQTLAFQTIEQARKGSIS